MRLREFCAGAREYRTQGMKSFMSVRFRLYGFCLSFIVVLVGSNFLLGFLVQQDESYKRARQEQYQRLAKITSVEQAMSAYRLAFGQANALALQNRQPWPAKTSKTVEERRREMELRLSELEPIDPQSARAVRTALKDLPMHLDAWLDAMLVGNQIKAQSSIAEINARLDVINQTLSSVSRKERTRTDEILEQERKRVATAIRNAGYIILLAGVVGILLAVLVVRSIIRPLRITTTAIRQVNAGETQIDLPPERPDEFGDMAVALRQFRDQAEKLLHLAYRDPLTGLGNRALLEDTLHRTIKAARTHGAPFALFYLDLDNFRSVNDSLGHSAGDRYLCEATERLLRFVPPGGTPYRYSGDKFAVLVTDTEPGKPLAPRLRVAADAILRGLAEPFRYGEHLLNMSVSIGIAQYPADGETGDRLISSADAAMYMAKKSGRNTLQFAGAQVTVDLRRQMAVANDIRRGLDRDEFEPFYQPIVDVVQGRVVGAEALLRWRHPERGLVMPGEFIAAAEETGLIHALGERCLIKAYHQALRLREEGRRIRIAVNLSVRQIHDGKILPVLRNLHTQAGLLDGGLEFELTESALLNRTEQSRQELDAIKALGYRLSMDDFGTGYSSLSYVQNLPIDKIKIDHSFVSKMETSKPARAIISATLALARNLDLEVVAEGVETEAQMRSLLELGCNLQQGFYFSPAIPPRELGVWIANYERGARRAQPA